MNRIKMIVMALSLVVLYSSIAMGSEKNSSESSNRDESGKASGKKDRARDSKKKPVAEEEITYLDMSTPDEPESEFPTVSKKGSL